MLDQAYFWRSLNILILELMGNNASCKVMGIGSVRVKMFDGIVRLLRNVRHVPDMKKNFISLGALDSNGCRCILRRVCLELLWELKWL